MAVAVPLQQPGLLNFLERLEIYLQITTHTSYVNRTVQLQEDTSIVNRDVTTDAKLNYTSCTWQDERYMVLCGHGNVADSCLHSANTTGQRKH